MKNINLKEFSKEELKILIEQAIEEVKRARLTEKEKEFLSFFKGGTVEKRSKAIYILFSDTGEQIGTRIELTQLNGLSFDWLEGWVRYNISDLTNQNYQITLTKFWESGEPLAIHCNTEKQANRLCKAFRKIGKIWSDGDSYLHNNHWKTYKGNTCYTNDNHYGIRSDYEYQGYKVFNFDEIDLEG